MALQSLFVSRHDEEAIGVIPLPVADTKTLEKVLDWCKKHTPVYKDAVSPDVLRKWEDEYLAKVVLTGFLDRLLTAANYLNIRELVDRLESSKMSLRSGRVYCLESFEGQVFVVEEEVALQLPLVRRHTESEEAGRVLVLEGADTRSLRKVIEWCKMHTPEKKATLPLEELRKWEEEYIDPCRVHDRLFMATIYMEMEELTNWLGSRIMTKAIAIAGKDPEEMGRQLRAGICVRGGGW